VHLVERIAEQIEQLSVVIFDQKVDIDFLETPRTPTGERSWQAVFMPAIAYDPGEDVFLLEKENLEYLFSNLSDYKKQRRIILILVAHQMRYRVQRQIPETILWTEDDPLLKNRKDIQEKVKRFRQLFLRYYPRHIHSVELDAEIIGYLVASEANESLERIADLIRYGPLVLQSLPEWPYFL